MPKLNNHFIEIHGIRNLANLQLQQHDILMYIKETEQKDACSWLSIQSTILDSSGSIVTAFPEIKEDISSPTSMESLFSNHRYNHHLTYKLNAKRGMKKVLAQENRCI